MSDEYELMRLAELRYALRRCNEADKGRLLIEIISWCAKHGIRAPREEMRQFDEAVNRYDSFHCRTLEEAFSLQNRKGNRIADKKREAELSFKVAYHIADMRELRIDTESAFDRASKLYDISFSQAREWYYTHRTEAHQALRAIVGEGDRQVRIPIEKRLTL